MAAWLQVDPVALFLSSAEARFGTLLSAAQAEHARALARLCERYCQHSSEPGQPPIQPAQVSRWILPSRHLGTAPGMGWLKLS